MAALSGKALRLRTFAFIAFIVALLVFIQYRYFRPTQPDGNVDIRYILSVKNTTNSVINDARVTVSAPVAQTATQKCGHIAASESYVIKKDDLGNQSIAFHWDIFPPLSTKFITIQSNVHIWDEPRKFDKCDPEDFLLSEPFIESEDARIIDQAEILKSGSHEQIVPNIFNWVSARITDQGYVGRNRGAAYALKHGKGDCTEYALLFTALCRAVGIPARPVGGFVCRHSSLVDASDYHNWAEFYQNGRWHIADPQKRILMRNDSYFIAFQYIRPSKGLNGYLIGKVEGKGLEVKIKAVNP